MFDSGSVLRPLEEVLQSELQNPGIERCPDLTERGAAQVRVRVTRPEAVGDVVGLRAQLKAVRLADPDDA